MRRVEATTMMGLGNKMKGDAATVGVTLVVDRMRKGGMLLVSGSFRTTIAGFFRGRDCSTLDVRRILEGPVLFTRSMVMPDKH